MCAAGRVSRQCARSSSASRAKRAGAAERPASNTTQTQRRNDRAAAVRRLAIELRVVGIPQQRPPENGARPRECGERTAGGPKGRDGSAPRVLASEPLSPASSCVARAKRYVNAATAADATAAITAAKAANFVQASASTSARTGLSTTTCDAEVAARISASAVIPHLSTQAHGSPACRAPERGKHEQPSIQRRNAGTRRTCFR